MNRRSFFKTLALGAGVTAGAGGVYVWRDRAWDRRLVLEPCCSEGSAAPPEIAQMAEPLRDEGSGGRPEEASYSQARAIAKSKDFDQHYQDDIILTSNELRLLESVAGRLERAQVVIGHGHFNLVSFDQLLDHARMFPSIGRLPSEEIDFLESTFSRDSRDLGFYGKKVLTNLGAAIPDKDVKKIAGTGHYLLRGQPLERYERIREDIGDSITLTSGVRGMVKQFQLFLSKAVTVDGNLSQAARSLAPPGHSHHARGDFDVGKVGLGAQNFTEDFAATDEYKKLTDLGYVEIRYEPGNPFGVRHEPWHIKIT